MRTNKHVILGNQQATLEVAGKFYVLKQYEGIMKDIRKNQMTYIRKITAWSKIIKAVDMQLGEDQEFKINPMTGKPQAR